MDKNTIDKIKFPDIIEQKKLRDAKRTFTIKRGGENKMKRRILTGDRPTGPLHLGHYVGSLENRIKFQDEYDCFLSLLTIKF